MGNETRRSVASAEWLGVSACLMGGGIEKPIIARAMLSKAPAYPSPATHSSKALIAMNRSRVWLGVPSRIHRSPS
jgi:hypothetical protein